jgi:hypothetical protein
VTVDPDHPRHHVILDVAVVEPRPRHLAPANAKLSPADRARVLRPSRDLPAVPMDVERVVESPIASTSHCTTSPTFAGTRACCRRSARPFTFGSRAAPEVDDELAVGWRPSRPRIESAPYMPPEIESDIDGEWSWYGHTPAASGPASSR